VASIFIDTILQFSETFNISNGLAPDSTITLGFQNKYSSPTHNYELLVKGATQNDNVFFNDSMSKNIFVKHGAMDIEVINIEANPSMQVGDTTYTCYLYYVYVSFKAVNTGKDTITSALFNYDNLYYPAVQWTLNSTLAPGDTIQHTFSQPYSGFIPYGFYRLYVTGKVNYPTYTYQHSIYEDFFAIVHAYKSNNDDSLYKWCPVGGSIDEVNNTKSLSISPNPATNIISIRYEGSLWNDNGHLSIYGVCGNEVKYIQISKPTEIINIDISSLSPGLYFIRLQNETEVLGSGKFIKE